METFLRTWREDAASRNQYESAIFIGDKLLALTNSDGDAIALAQLHFSNGNFTRALSLLTRRDLVERNLECTYLAAHCHVRAGRYEEALTIVGDKAPSNVLATSNHNRRKIPRTGGTKHKSAKPLQAGSQDTTPEEEHRVEEERRKQNKFHAGMCYLRGLCYAKQNAFDRAKECYKEAVKIDVQCFEAFDQLMKNALMSPDEEWKFLESLDFDSIVVPGNISAAQEAAEMTKMLYVTRISKYEHPAAFTTATETLSTHYKLASNPDLLQAKADLLFVQCRFREALALTEAILADDRYNFSALPIHLACLHELHEKNALFLLAHDLAEKHPEEPTSWLAVGVYYLSTGKIAEARRMFSKSSMMDPHFGPAWIGFAHTFAAEGEHDQAIAAYTTSARLFQGTHLPQLFLGMQNLQLLNMTLAKEYLTAAYQLCAKDPLLLNEMGVVAYHDGQMANAAKFFVDAIQVARDIGAEPASWIATRINLGHVYRRIGQWNEALAEYDEVLRLGGRDVGALTAKALVLLEMGIPWKATVALHEALDVDAQDGVANELLGKALEECAFDVGGDGIDGQGKSSFVKELDAEAEEMLGQRKEKGKETLRRKIRSWNDKSKEAG